MFSLSVLCVFGLAYLFHARVSAVATTDATLHTEPVEIGLYYETLCPYCQAFVIKQLLPAYLKAPERLKLKLVPYGNAETYDTPEGYTFTCQHGPRECEANKIHSCAVDIVQDQGSVVKLVECMIHNETDPEAVGKQCAVDLGIGWQPILDCSRGARGSLLLKHNGEATKALRPKVRGVPTVTLNGSQQNQTALRKNLWGEICSHLSDPKPTDCPELNVTPLVNSEEQKTRN